MRKLGYLFSAVCATLGCGDGGENPNVPDGAGGLMGAAGSAGNTNEPMPTGGAGGNAGTATSMPNGGTGGSAAACITACGDRTCGADPNCGVSCGTCSAGLECVAGECRSPTPLRENGDTCSTGSECASGFCAESQVGESRCYGVGEANDVCGDVFDCAGGLCLSRSGGQSQTVCVDGINVCFDNQVSSECTDSTVAFCQFIQFCGDDVSSDIPSSYRDFDVCVGSECVAANDGVEDLTPAECVSFLNFMNSGTAPCP